MFGIGKRKLSWRPAPVPPTDVMTDLHCEMICHFVCSVSDDATVERLDGEALKVVYSGDARPEMRQAAERFHEIALTYLHMEPAEETRFEAIRVGLVVALSALAGLVISLR